MYLWHWEYYCNSYIYNQDHTRCLFWHNCIVVYYMQYHLNMSNINIIDQVGISQPFRFLPTPNHTQVSHLQFSRWGLAISCDYWQPDSTYKLETSMFAASGAPSPLHSTIVYVPGGTLSMAASRASSIILSGYQMMGAKLRPTPHTLSDHLHHPESDMYSAQGISTLNWARCFYSTDESNKREEPSSYHGWLVFVTILSENASLL